MAGKTIKIRYDGPCDMVRVAPYGEHYNGVEKEYPEDFAKELIETSKKQQFSIVKISGKSISAEPKKIKNVETKKTDSKADDKPEDDGKVAVTMIGKHQIFEAGKTYRMNPHSAEKLVSEGKAKYTK